MKHVDMRAKPPGDLERQFHRRLARLASGQRHQNRFYVHGSLSPCNPKQCYMET
jgi:hypothetical protein